jgi:protein TonB
MKERNEDDMTRGGRLSRWLIRRAAQAAPAELSQRLEEEWLADLEARRSAMSRLRFALGCAWATGVIAHDHSIATLTVGAPAFAARAAAAAARSNPGRLSRRSTIFGLVALLHVAVFYAFMTGLSGSLSKTITPPLQNRVLDPPRPRELPPLPPPNLNPLKLDLPELQPDIRIPPDTSKERTPDVVAAKPVLPGDDSLPATPPQAPPVHVAALTQGGPGAGFPTPDDYYPLLARHLEEQGAATVRVCVNASGRLTDEPTVVSSSGSTRLDEGALRLARAGSGHYRPSTEDGRAVNACYPLRIRFQLKN